MSTGDLILSVFAIIGCVALPALVFLLAFVRLLDGRREGFVEE